MRSRSSHSLVLIALSVCACASVNLERVEIRQRRSAANPFAFDPSQTTEVSDSYREELRAVEARRPGSKAIPGPDGDLTGLALSGGGIRSATLSLGVLERLNSHSCGQRLASIDYMSAVSGGAYTAGWFQAHVGVPQDANSMYDERGYQVGARTTFSLLREEGDSIRHLRTYAGFVKGNGWFDAPALAWEYLWRLPISLIVDTALHVKGHYNRIHLIDLYKDRIDSTYFHGRSDAALRDMNGGATTTPYLIINGNLVASGKSWSGEGSLDTSHYNFEFTRHFTGSDGIGYIESRAFDLPVERVDFVNGVPLGAEFDSDALDGNRFPISYAVAASGAAFDPDGYLTRLDNVWVRSPASILAGPLNLDLGYEAWNFAPSLRGWWSPLDYLRMMTIQRLHFPFQTVGSRWIKISDGGHYDNTGVLALLRRGVTRIIALDAGADPNFERKDRESLRNLVRDDLSLGWTTVGDEEHVVLTSQGRAVARILFLKPRLESGKDSVVFRGVSKTSEDVRKIVAFQEHPTVGLVDFWKKDFPQTTTLRQWYGMEQFEAYRRLGSVLALTGVCKSPDPFDFNMPK